MGWDGMVSNTTGLSIYLSVILWPAGRLSRGLRVLGEVTVPVGINLKGFFFVAHLPSAAIRLAQGNLHFFSWEFSVTSVAV